MSPVDGQGSSKEARAEGGHLGIALAAHHHGFGFGLCVCCVFTMR